MNKIKDKSQIDEYDEEDDAFARMLRKISKKPEAPKREHPKPFRNVKIVDLSKTNASVNSKATPVSVIKSIKCSAKSFSSKTRLFHSDEKASAFIFDLDPTEKERIVIIYNT